MGPRDRPHLTPQRLPPPSAATPHSVTKRRVPGLDKQRNESPAKRPLTRCGRANCRCHADPPRRHGPYHQWTRKKNGKTSTRILTDDQLADYAPWFDNHRRLRELITELEALSLAIAENDPRWNR